jgi:hypothetical protein
MKNSANECFKVGHNSRPEDFSQMSWCNRPRPVTLAKNCNNSRLGKVLGFTINLQIKTSPKPFRFMKIEFAKILLYLHFE